MGEKAKRIAFQVGFVLVACIIIEMVLRFMGYAPGDLRPNWLYFKPVDSLYVIPDFNTDEQGVLVADKNYWTKEGVYINKEGFRTKEFEQLDSTKKKILFIGDSFTWGLSADPFYDSSFCDILGRETSYEIVNTGIPATDPPQYNKIAETLIPRLKPDMVFVMFYMGNDLIQADRKVGKPFYYWTNAGGIVTDIDGQHFENAHDAYNYLANQKYYLKQPVRWYEKIIGKSALLSRLYAGKFRIQEKMNFERTRKDAAITKRYLNSIKHIAEQNNTKVRFVLIPELKEADKGRDDYLSRYSDLLEDADLKDYWLMPFPAKDDFKQTADGHLNNKGHRCYAEYLKGFLRDSL